ncbi:MAG: flavin-containing monooxygenase, partial [Ktedonobacterales bacterium]
PGLDRFAGTLFHSAQWDATYDLTGKRVAVIGTGASAIQFVPHIQPKVAHLTLFQRTPPWILPRLDRAITRRERLVFHALPLAQRLERAGIYFQREISVLALVYRPAAIRSTERLALRHLCRQVADPALRGKLMPTYTMGCKRILLSDDFYPAVTQPNVSLVTERIREVREHSIVTGDGQERDVDAILCGTGFHVTDMPAAQYISGRGGVTLAEAWRDGPEAYLGTTIAGFPNFFLLIGPNTGLGHSSMVYMIESQVAYILDCLCQMRQRGARVVEVRQIAQTAFNAEMRRRMRGTVWASGCSSWYLDAGGQNTTLWPGFTWEFRRRTRRFDAASYDLGVEAASRPVGAAAR